MSPQTKKAWGDSTLYLRRLGVTVLCFFASWGFYSVVDYIKDINSNVELLLKHEAVNLQKEKEQEKFNAEIKQAVNHNAEITQIHTGQIIRINAKIGIE